VGFVADKVALGQIFSEYFGFPCQFSFHLLLHIHHHLSSGAGTIGQLVADIPSGLKSHLTNKERKKEKEPDACGYNRATLPLVDINTETWYPMLGIGRKVDELAL
jgi:hypothetical protein